MRDSLSSLTNLVSTGLLSLQMYSGYDSRHLCLQYKVADRFVDDCEGASVEYTAGGLPKRLFCRSLRRSTSLSSLTSTGRLGETGSSSLLCMLHAHSFGRLRLASRRTTIVTSLLR